MQHSCLKAYVILVYINKKESDSVNWFFFAPDLMQNEYGVYLQVYMELWKSRWNSREASQIE